MNEQTNLNKIEYGNDKKTTNFVRDTMIVGSFISSVSKFYLKWSNNGHIILVSKKLTTKNI